MDLDDYLAYDESIEEYDYLSEFLSSDECSIKPNYFLYKNLNVQDYNLNSPLISDDIYGYKRHLTGFPYPIVFKKKEWEKRDVCFKNLKYDFNKLREPEELHRWWSGLISNEYHGNQRIISLLKEAWEDHADTSVVYTTFLKNWLGDDRELNINMIPWNEDRVLKWGEFFIQLHDMVLMLNASDDEEIKSLNRWMNSKILKKNGELAGIRIDNFLGTCYLAGGSAFLMNHNVLIDRGFLLMMKDLCVARFNTLLGMYLRVDHKFSQEDINSLMELYSIGDKILEESGSQGYKVIKLLEPCCNLMFCIKAREFRPLVPDFPSFRNHVDRAFQDTTEFSTYSIRFKNLILETRTIDLLTVFYSSFRHWGHPFINYFEGLRALHEQVTIQKNIDDDYAQALGSDLAFLVLKKKFSEKKKWYVDKDLLPSNHVFKEHILNNTWPTPKQIEDFGDRWHLLPLIKCFDIPDVIDPSLLYSDKSHSMDLDEIREHIRYKKNEPIPTRKVLQTLLHRPATNWPQFLQRINDHGISPNSLAIGLKPKEREIKEKGRFFSLMTWELREYFVITEYLIKTHFVPLFSGLTMADDLNTVLSKLLDRTQGQGGTDYENICIANHIDYEKWNNHKRFESTRYVFKVMGQFLGYPSLIEITHLIFQKCFVYFTDRPDLMEIIDDIIQSTFGFLVCWSGQLGGFEGLRQKGWTVIDLLMIAREARIRNTLVKTLAQGDNQVVCTIYRLNFSPTLQDKINNLNKIHQNNEVIMDAIKRGTTKLGLIINEDETMQSADYLNYGKIPIFRGRILNLFTKRLSRIMCTSNDQILSFGNIMTTVSTNALTISHFDESPVHAMHYYNFFGNFTRSVLERHNPILRGPPRIILRKENFDVNYKIAALYLDPSLGGVCGMAPTRFLTRGFPDPVSESLSFWKFLHDHTNNQLLKDLSRKFGDPPITTADRGGLSKLLEKPSSLNIPKGLSITNLLRTEIKKSLQSSIPDIQNEVIAHALDYLNHEEDRLMGFLSSIKPLFPRFLSEFRASTFVGIVDGLVGLFQNSRTIRRSFSKKMQRDINMMTYKSELSTYDLLIRFKSSLPGNMWECSSDRADQLRRMSWGEPVLGTTVPHPLEMFGKGFIREGGICEGCVKGTGQGDFITTLAPLGLSDYYLRRGPYPAYLGSKTSETTSIIHPWEKETNIGLIKKSLKLRNSIHWFVNPMSNLAQSILSVSSGLTGEDWSGSMGGFKRTGSALHRFGCSRQSAGGYAAINPCKLSWVLSTTDTFSIIGDKNFDFMFQPSILCAQLNTVELFDGVKGSITVHHHLSCKKCLREIEEPILDSTFLYVHPDMSQILSKWKPDNSPWGERKDRYTLQQIKASDMTHRELSYQIGRSTGFLYGDMLLGDNKHVDDNSIFPLSLQFKVFPDMYFQGLIDGLMKATGISIIHRRSVAKLNRPKPALIGGMIHCIDNLCKNVNFINLVRKGPIYGFLTNHPHKVPSSYPINDSDLGVISRGFMKREFSNIEKMTTCYKPLYHRVCVFSDMASPELIGPYLLSTRVLPILFKSQITEEDGKKLRSYRDESVSVRECGSELVNQINPKSAVQCIEEIRHAAKEFKGVEWKGKNKIKWGKEITGRVSECNVEYSTEHTSPTLSNIPQYRCPLISGLRIFQMATGAHYKLRTIVSELGIKYHDFLCGGDGSGGMTSALLRLNWRSRCIFNSLIEYSGVSVRGAQPGGPPAIEALGPDKSRCVNFATIWEDPTDLSTTDCWINFAKIKRDHNLKIDLVVLDMEVREDRIADLIEDNLEEFGLKLITRHATILYKTYLTRLIKQPTCNVLTKVGKYFKRVKLIQTSFTSSRSSEVYVLMDTLKARAGVDKHIRWAKLECDIQQFAVFRSEIEELRRAEYLKGLNMLEGVPKELIPDLEIEMSSVLSSMGLDDGVSVQLARHVLILGRHDPGTMFWVLVGIGGNGIISMTSEHISGFEIPSDSACINMISLVLGCGYWLSYQMSDEKLFRYCNHINDNHIVLQFFKRRYTRISKKEETKKISYRVDWRVSEEGHIRKKVMLSSKQALIGTWIRLLRRTCKPGYEFSPAPEEIWKSFNQKITWKNIKERTGLWDMIIDKNPGFEHGHLVMEVPQDKNPSYVD
ncbi:polymerase [Le Dantec virus]|uniref:Replicase n=1 Tax=Le Dantec virus TaxID=318848 RepID=A0A0D3R1R3_9RHAB|nr:polymerase [Le Dantec virus]AJR28452.1 polymerase [Le Dantec virus]